MIGRGMGKEICRIIPLPVILLPNISLSSLPSYQDGSKKVVKLTKTILGINDLRDLKAAFTPRSARSDTKGKGDGWPRKTGPRLVFNH
jgi:hypothetical protein